MLQRAWYLVDTDFLSDPDTRLMPESAEVIGRVSELLAHDAGYGPAVTTTALHLAIIAADYLGDATRFCLVEHTAADIALLVGGLNQLQAHLIQTVQRLAEHTTHHSLPGLATTGFEAVTALATSFAIAGTNGEISCGHLKEAYLNLGQLADQSQNGVTRP